MRLPKGWAISAFDETVKSFRLTSEFGESIFRLDKIVRLYRAERFIAFINLIIHQPVLLNEVIKYLEPVSDRNYIDATADGGGHAIAIVQAIRPRGRLLAIEWDEELLKIIQQRLEKECPGCEANYLLSNTSYTELTATVNELNFKPVHGILFDFGMSSFHVEQSGRGFSFQKDEPLDMRYSLGADKTAADILNRSAPDELEKIIKNFGEERFARPIVKKIILARRIRPILKTSELVEVIKSATPNWYHHSRLHFATRTFQALRIIVNHEFENIALGLAQAAEILEVGGRIITIAFHSLEDRIVKTFFREPSRKNNFKSLTKKPVRPGPSEIKGNPRSRSSRMRAFEKIS